MAEADTSEPGMGFRKKMMSFDVNFCSYVIHAFKRILKHFPFVTLIN